MKALIQAIEAQQSTNRQRSEASTLRFLQSFPRLRTQALASMAPHFNLLDLCGLGTDERRHSAILAWLLDEAASHTQGTRFFKAFARLCGVSPLQRMTGYTVRTEFPGFESLTDIVLYRKGGFFLSIENKLLAEEGDDQLDREYRDLTRWASCLQIPKERRVAIFLTPEGRKPETGHPGHWHSLSYPELAAAFRVVISQASSPKLSFFIDDWLASLETLTPAAYVDQRNQTPH